MTRSEREPYRKALEAKKVELSTAWRSRGDITIEKAADALDEVQYASERELAIRNLDRESKLLRSVRTALDHIEDGSYGVCLHCNSVINRKRLDAVPWATYCVACQEAADLHEFDDEIVGSLKGAPAGVA